MTVLKVSLFVAACSALTACHATAPSKGDVDPSAEPAIQLKTTPCMGTCPEFLLQIFRDGTVVYVGLRNVQTIGTARSKITSDAVSKLLRSFEAAGFFALDDAYYRAGASDIPSSVVTLRDGGRSKAISRQHIKGVAPEDLVRLEREVEDAVTIERWIGVDDRRGHDFDIDAGD